MESSEKQSRKPNPRENAFFLSAATFCYTIPTFLTGFKRDLEEKDLAETLLEHKSSKLGNQMEKYWKMEEDRAYKNKTRPSLERVLFKTFGWEFLFYGVVLVLCEVMRINQPLFLGKLLRYFTPKNNSPKSYPVNRTEFAAQNQDAQLLQPMYIGNLISFYTPNQHEISQEEAYWYATGVVLCSLVNVLFMHPYMMGVLHIGMKMRVGCCSLIYRKSLKLSKTALGETTAGQIVNLLSNDVNRFDVAVIFVHNLWIGPLETIICTYFMYLQVGIAAVFGVLALIVLIPMQIYFGKKVSILRLKTALRTDERVRLMNEIISGIQVIKMYAWEKPFNKLAAMARRYEIQLIRSTSYIRGILLSFIMYCTRISIFVSILTYVLLGNDITAEKVFVLTAFYNILRQTMTVFFPQGISQVAEAMVSIRRLNKFMLYDETQLAKAVRKAEMNGTSEETKPGMNGVEVHGEPGVYLTNATAKWTEASSDNTLTGLNLKVTPGKLMGVIGPVGSGKTSLFHALLQELPLKEGTLKVNGIISYASQEPWLFAGTVRQNILFGLPLDKSRYKTVVRNCALERDFRLLPYGDRTIVGDRGVSLSGGQRARINLARAVYKQADIYLLDDPLSAVDTHVGKELFEQCITGYLRNKTVILITHQLQYLKEVDNILFLEDGNPKTGTFRELQASGLDFTKVLGDNQEESEQKMEEQSELVRQGSVKSMASLEVEAPKQIDEQKSTGSVGSYVYKEYFKAGGNCCVIFTMFVLFVTSQIVMSASDYFITYWVNIEQTNNLRRYPVGNISDTPSHLSNATSTPPPSALEKPLQDLFEMYLRFGGEPTPISNDTAIDFWTFERNTCIYIYSVIIILLVVVTLIRSFHFFSVCMRASTNLHDNMFESISRATMRFFNTNSAGRILNRFSKDIGSIDELLNAAMIDCLQIGLSFIGIIAVIGVVSPMLMIPTFAVGILFYLMRIFYLRTSRNVKRLEGVTRSPVFSHMNASLLGLTTIRAFEAEEILTKEFDNHQDLHSSAWFSFISTSRAFGYWLDLICILYIVLVTFSFLLVGQEKFGGNVGLAITQAIGLTGMLQWGMRQSTELENQMTSVERVLEYNNIEHEPPFESAPDKKPRDTWPEHGRLEFKDVFLRYFPQDPFVLKYLNFVINPKEKVGIVGRTGAGKSSLINAIFQLTEIIGQIFIDDVEISTIGLHDLRSRISIIPQEPVLFSGTMRKNLDPFEEYTDDDLWRALEDVELKEAVLDLTSGLNSKMSEGGSNFSVGQRQLVCLARAILRNNKLLVLDEATANVDPQTDALIQNTIRKKFENCTVLTIAHRLNTVMDSDKVMVMDAGTLKEFDHPYKLLQNKEGLFYSMLQQTGKALAESLYNVAEQSYMKTRDS